MSGDYPTLEWAKSVCKIGQGHDTCRYLCLGARGWSCEKRGELRLTLDRRVAALDMVARGNNCEGKDAR